MTSGTVAHRLQQLRGRIETANQTTGRPKDAVTLVAVSKRQPVDLIRELSDAGQSIFAESYAQELSAKQAALTDLKTLSWHYIGHLQSNKAKVVVGHCKLIQSVDSDRIAGKIAGIAACTGSVQEILVEVNLSGDRAKTGVDLHEALGLCERASGLPGIRLVGLMGMAPAMSAGSPDLARKSFAQLKLLFDRLPTENRRILSMGMSGDFVQAISEGSTMVRIGRSLFGDRQG